MTEMSQQPDQRPKARSWLSQEWDAVNKWLSRAQATVNRRIEQVSEVGTEAMQESLDSIDDAKHPLYTAVEMGLSAIFGKQAMKSMVDTLLGSFDEKSGTGEFSQALHRWQRELNRDLGVPGSPITTRTPTPGQP
jgi:hypothetical protein